MPSPAKTPTTAVDAHHVAPPPNESVNKGITLVCLENHINSKHIPKTIEASAAKFDGIRVQNYNGETGTLRWIGEIMKGSIWGKGMHGAVEYDTPIPTNPHRTDGVFIPFKVALADHHQHHCSDNAATTTAADGASSNSADNNTANAVAPTCVKEDELSASSHADTAAAPVVIRYATCPPSTCGFTPLRHLYYEVIPSAVNKIREHFAAANEPLFATEMHDFMIVKFLIARQFIWDKVLLMMTNHAEWLKTAAAPRYDPDAIFDPGLAKYFPIGDSIGTDMEGNLLHYCRPGSGGAISPENFLKRFGGEQCYQWHLQEMLSMQHRLQQDNFKAKRYTVIYDLKDIGSVDSKVISWGKMIGQLHQDHNPEMLARAFMINTPLLFRGAFSLFQLVLDERTNSKIKVLGSDYQKEVEKYIDVEYLPEFAGGTNNTWLANEGAVGKKVSLEEWALISEQRKATTSSSSSAAATTTAKK